MPPSEIAATWSADELQNAEVLADLEGWGQQKRLVARLCAEIHNAVINAVHATHAAIDAKPPQQLRESQFLPVRIKRPNIAKTAESKQKVLNSNLQKVSQIVNAMAGF